MSLLSPVPYAVLMRSLFVNHIITSARPVSFHVVSSHENIASKIRCCEVLQRLLYSVFFIWHSYIPALASKRIN